MTYWKLHFIFLRPVEQSNSIIPYHNEQPQHDYHFSISLFPRILKKNVSIMSIMQQSRREIQMIIKTEDNCLQRIQNDVCTQMVTMIVIFIPSGVEY